MKERVIRLTLTVTLIISLGYSCKKENSNDSVVIGNYLEVQKTDLGKMNYTSALSACSALGNGWRLPTVEEWRIICENKNAIPNLVLGEHYWSSAINPNAVNGIYGYYHSNNSCGGAPNYLYRNETWQVRAVKNR